MDRLNCFGFGTDDFFFKFSAQVELAKFAKYDGETLLTRN